MFQPNDCSLAEKVEFYLNCPNCDKEIVDENAEICPNCGEPLTTEEENEEELQVIDTQPKSGDTIVAVAVLTIIAAVIIASLGCVGIYQYPTLIDYYGASYASNFMGFAIFGAIDIICGLAAMVGGIFMLKRRHLKISVLGAVFVLAAVGATYITIVQYEYNFADIVLFSSLAALMFSIV
ncbi:MAG: hypothetical protein CW691_03185, partial [Candidatus Bathyarchaeum sp.]